MSLHTARVPAAALWRSLQLPAEAISRLHLSEQSDPINSIGLSALAAAHFHQLNTGLEQTVSVDARHAALEFKSEAYYAIEGVSNNIPLFEPLAGLYRTKDGYVRIHTNFPHHKQGILDILQCEPTRDSVAAALARWSSEEFETEASSRKMVATALRSFTQWDQHPQAHAVAKMSPVTLIKVGDAPRRNLQSSSNRPLHGIRVLDLTRVLAGPVCGRTLAAHGADVLWVTSPSLPALPMIDLDTSRGKRTTQLDLNNEIDRECLRSLVKDADIFLQAYRPGGLASRGFSVEEVTEMKPGIVYASLNAYGWDGPWKDRRGFDSLVQTASGFNVAEAEAHAAFLNTSEEPPRPLPMQALDHAAGYLLAFGIQAALCKTIIEGGSWEVRVSLAAVGQWIRSLGRIDSAVAFGQGQPLPPRSMEDAEVLKYTSEIPEMKTLHNGPDIPLRTMRAVRHAAVLSATPVEEGEAPMRLDGHRPEWL